MRYFWEKNLYKSCDTCLSSCHSG